MSQKSSLPQAAKSVSQVLMSDTDPSLALLREAMVSTEGYAGVLARYTFVGSLGWHLAADPTWTEERLVRPLLLSRDSDALVYWHAVANSGDIYPWVIKRIGVRQAEVATDAGLSIEARSNLADALLYATLFDFWGNREPSAPHSAIQQMLRSVDDYVRSNAAHVPERFIKGRVEKGDAPTALPDPALVFYRSVKPLLDEVWPLERSLATPGVAKAFASLPSVCGTAFADAAATVERFMVPFEMWSLLDFGLIELVGGTHKIAVVKDAEQAKAALSLVDRAIGYADNVRIPYDLHRLLDHVITIAPAVQRTPIFQRLEALTRR
jgi:hypothetical protein